MPFHALVSAETFGHIELARYFITDTESGLNHVNVDTPFVSNLLLWMSMDFCSEAMVRFIITELNGDPHVVDADGSTAIMVAAFFKLEGIVRMMAVDMGVDLLARNAEGRDVLYHAVQGGSVGVLSFLVEEMGLDIITNYCWYGWLHGAAQLGHVDLTRWLLDEK